MKAVILAGGLGSRLARDTEDLPKPLVNIGGRPIIWHIMKSYSHFGINDFVICCGYKGELIKSYFYNFRLETCDITIDMTSNEVTLTSKVAEPWKVTLIDTGLKTMTGGRLKRVERHVGDTFCMTYGDGVGDIDIGKLIESHIKSQKLATVTAVKPPGRFGVLDLEGNNVKEFSEKTDAMNAWINGGFFVLNKKSLSYIKGDTTIWEKEPLQTLAQAGELNAYRHSGFWKPMDTPRDLNSLRHDWKNGTAKWKVWN